MRDRLQWSVAAAFLCMAFLAASNVKAADDDKKSDLKTVTFNVKGMT